jgi:hypothetical protein
VIFCFEDSVHPDPYDMSGSVTPLPVGEGPGVRVCHRPFSSVGGARWRRRHEKLSLTWYEAFDNISRSARYI